MSIIAQKAKGDQIMAKAKKKNVVEYTGFEEAAKAAEEVLAYIEFYKEDEITAGQVNAAKTILREKGWMSITDFRSIFDIAFSENMSAKMETVTALSTSCIVNPFCLARMRNGDNICANCFSVGLQLFKPSVRENTIENFKVLNTVVIPAMFWPLVCNDMLRFEAFGDLYTWKQAANYFECAKRNKGTRCALWTKNPEVIAEAIRRGYKKPSNLIIVYSSPKKNTVAEREKLLAMYPFIDKIFTVFEEEYIKANNIDINCGARSCRGCQRCYHKTKELEFINERKK